VTYSSALEETQKDLYFNGEAVITMYQPEAHSDGDSIVFFRRSDVLVVGDVFDQTRFRSSISRRAAAFRASSTA
jgi:hypothetical protein